MSSFQKKFRDIDAKVTMNLRTMFVLHGVIALLLMCSTFVVIAGAEGCMDPRFQLIGESCLYLHFVPPYEFIYSDAVGICQDLGGSVPVINTQQEFDDVLQLMVNQGEKEFVVWVGCKSPAGSQEFKCLDETVYYKGASDSEGYWKWRTGFPNPAAATSTCVLFFQDKKDVADSAEYDDDCESTLSPVICEEGTSTKRSVTTVTPTSLPTATTTSISVTRTSAAVTTTPAAVTTSAAVTTTSAAVTTTSSTTMYLQTSTKEVQPLTTVGLTTSLPPESGTSIPEKGISSKSKDSSTTETTRVAVVSETSVPSSTETAFAHSITMQESDTPQRTCFLYGKSTATPARFTSSLMWHLKDDVCAQDHVVRKISNARNVVVCTSVCGTYKSCQFVSYYPENDVCELSDTQ